MFPNNNNSNNVAFYKKDLIDIKNLLTQLDKNMAFFNPTEKKRWNYPLLVIAQKIFPQASLAEHRRDKNPANTNPIDFTPLQENEGTYLDGRKNHLARLFSIKQTKKTERRSEEGPIEDFLLCHICAADTSIEAARKVILTVKPFKLQMKKTTISPVDSSTRKKRSNGPQNDEIQFTLETNKKPSTLNLRKINYEKKVFFAALGYTQNIEDLESEIVQLKMKITTLQKTLQSTNKKCVQQYLALKQLLSDNKPKEHEITLMREIILLHDNKGKMQSEIDQIEGQLETADTELVAKRKTFISTSNSEITHSGIDCVSKILDRLSRQSNDLLNSITLDEQVLTTKRNAFVQKLNTHRNKIKQHEPKISPITIGSKHSIEEENWINLMKEYSQTSKKGGLVKSNKEKKPSGLSKVLVPTRI